MENKDGFDLQKLDREVDALLSDVKELLEGAEETPLEEDAQSTEQTPDVEPEVPQTAQAEPTPDATIVFKPLTFYEQSKPAYQSARRAQYEREREQARLERERQQLAREAEEEKRMQELEQRQKRPHRRVRTEPPVDEQAYADWLYEQGGDVQTMAQREAVSRRTQAAASKGKKKKRHPVRTALLAVLALLIAGAVTLLVMAKQPTGEETADMRREDCSTILIAGTDADGYRTDTMMLLSIDRGAGTIGLVSIPRDTLVYCEYSVPKINSAYGWAGGGEDGMQELMQRVSEVIGFRPDGYVLIDLEGFEALVDHMGGVEYNVPMDMQYSDPTQGLSIDLKAGTQKLSGAEAMQLVRYRSGYAQADLDRVTVQREFVKAALSQWLTPGKLLRLPGALRLLREKTKTDLTKQHFLWLAESAALCDLENIRMQTLPGTAAYIGGGAYYVLDPAGVAETVNTYCNPYAQGIAVSDLSIRVG